MLALYALAILLRDHPLDRPISTEDGIWFRGDRFVYTLRWTSSLIYRHFSAGLFGDLLVGYKLPGALLHLLNAMLVYAAGAALSRRAGPAAARLGGFLAGWLFIHTAVSASVVVYFSALAYMLLTLLAGATLAEAELSGADLTGARRKHGGADEPTRASAAAVAPLPGPDLGIQGLVGHLAAGAALRVDPAAGQRRRAGPHPAGLLEVLVTMK